jgi:alpha-tubulin suppressor-like RCC1 family protein
LDRIRKRFLTTLSTYFYSKGQLGTGSSSTTPTKTTVALSLSGAYNGASPIIQVSAGNTHSLIVTQNGKIYTVGAGDQGQLGTGTASSHSNFVAVSIVGDYNGVSPVVNAFAGYLHSIFMTADGKVYSTGSNT